VKSLKYAIGAFVTSPNKSVEVESGVVPMKHQRQLQRTKYACKVLTNNKHPLYTNLKDNTNDHKYAQRTKPPITFTLRQDLQSANIRYDINLNQTQITNFPPWTKTEHKYDISLTKFDKRNTSNEVLKTEFNKKINKYKQKGYEAYYTDGSKTGDGYGCAVIEGSNVHRFRCHSYSSVYSTELFAVSRAINIADRRKKTKIIICTDSLSAVKGIQDSQTKHPLVKEIQDQLTKTRTIFTFMWIPSHVGILGNEKADVEAKQATLETFSRQYKVIYTDMYRNIRELTRQKWQMEWDVEINTQNKLGTLKKTTDRWKEIDYLNRKDQTVITRLRIGHTRLTHGHLLEKTNNPSCNCSEPLTVQHILSCDLNKQIQDKHKINFETLKEDNKEKLLKVIEYLKELNLYDKI
jgi:ribonuclease HI